MDKELIMKPAKSPENRNEELLTKQEEVNSAHAIMKKAEASYAEVHSELAETLNDLFFNKLIKRQKTLVNLMNKFYGHELYDKRASLLMKGKASPRFDEHWNSNMKDDEWYDEKIGFVYNHDYSWLPFLIRPQMLHSVNTAGLIVKTHEDEYVIPFGFFDMGENELVQFFRKRRKFFNEFIEKPDALKRKEKNTVDAIKRKKKLMEQMQKEISEMEKTLTLHQHEG